MFSIQVPHLKKRDLPKNSIGLTIDDYEGAPSTLCAGCGHDSITKAIIQAFYELGIEPHRVAKLSGIGCSSKTPAYFLGTAHGFNSVHGRMPTIATGANAANKDMIYIGVSGDGDSGSIGLGHFVHLVRRKIKMVYIIENNGVYGLTKGQFSATADKNTLSKKGDENKFENIDLLDFGKNLGATLVGRGFSGDKEELVPMIKQGLTCGGFALFDVLSPCVSFNNHDGSTKSYDYIRKHLKTGILYRSEHPEEFHTNNKTCETPLRDLSKQDLCPGKHELERMMNSWR